MSALDITIIIVFVGAIAYGLRRGFIVQIGSVVGVIVGILACRLFGDTVARWLASGESGLSASYISGVFANVLLFLVGYVSTRLIARLLQVVTKTLKLGVVDRIAGALFCLFEWFFVFSLVLNIWQSIRPSMDVAASSHIAGGRAARAIVDFAPLVMGSETASEMFSTIGVNSTDE